MVENRRRAKVVTEMSEGIRAMGEVMLLTYDRRICNVTYRNLFIAYFKNYLFPIGYHLKEILYLYKLICPWYRSDIFNMLSNFRNNFSMKVTTNISPFMRIMGLDKPIYPEHRVLSLKSLLSIDMRAVEAISECIINMALVRRSMDKYLSECYCVSAIMKFRLSNNDFVNFEWIGEKTRDGAHCSDFTFGYGFWKFVAEDKKRRLFRWTIMNMNFYTLSSDGGVCLPPFPNLHKRFGSFAFSRAHRNYWSLAGDIWFVIDRTPDRVSLELDDDGYDTETFDYYCSNSSAEFSQLGMEMSEESFLVYCNDFYLDVNAHVLYPRGFYQITITADNKLTIKKQ